MNTNALNRALLRIVSLGWVGFVVVAIAIRTVFAAPEMTLLVDRSYCEPAQWAGVSDRYEQLYQQNQRGEIVLKSVIFFSDLGEETSETPPEPGTFRNLKTYGKPSPERRTALASTYPDATVLSCTP